MYLEDNITMLKKVISLYDDSGISVINEDEIECKQNITPVLNVRVSVNTLYCIDRKIFCVHNLKI